MTYTILGVRCYVGPHNPVRTVAAPILRVYKLLVLPMTAVTIAMAIVEFISGLVTVAAVAMMTSPTYSKPLARKY